MMASVCGVVAMRTVVRPLGCRLTMGHECARRSPRDSRRVVEEVPGTAIAPDGS